MPDSCLHEVASFLAMRIGEQALAYPHRPRCRGYDAGRVWIHLSAKKIHNPRDEVQGARANFGSWEDAAWPNAGEPAFFCFFSY